jgi:hypothetical protein
MVNDISSSPGRLFTKKNRNTPRQWSSMTVMHLFLGYIKKLTCLCLGGARLSRLPTIGQILSTAELGFSKRGSPSSGSNSFPTRPQVDSETTRLHQPGIKWARMDVSKPRDQWFSGAARHPSLEYGAHLPEIAIFQRAAQLPDSPLHSCLEKNNPTLSGKTMSRERACDFFSGPAVVLSIVKTARM